jgi:dephospho-CoA kinase
MKVIGLTGGIACGKTTLADMLRRLGAVIIDADELSRSLTADGGEALPYIRQAFGDGVFQPSGSLDRRKLGQVVFGNEEARETLNGILHPMVYRRMEEELAKCRDLGVKVVVLDVPLLFETHGETLADLTLCAIAPEETQISRLKSRNGLSRDEALSRIRSQMPNDEKARRSDIVIDTDRPLMELEEKIQTLYQEWNRP